MSVINTMLKDLEKRNNDFAENNTILQGLGARPQHPQPATPSKNNYLLTSLISIGVILVFVVIIYFVSPYQLVKTVPQAVIAENTHQDLKPTGATEPDTRESAAVANIQPQETTQAASTTTIVTTPQPVETAPQVTAKAATPKPVEKQVIVEAQKEPARKQAKEITPTKKQTSSTTSSVTNNDDIEADAKSSISKTPRAFSNEEKSKQAYAAAMNQYNQGQQRVAKDLLKEALSYSPKNNQARQLLAAIHIFEQRPDIAATVIEQGLAINANDLDLLRVYLQALVQMANYPKAISVMEKHFQSTTPEDMAYLAGLYQKNKQHMHAVKFFSQALRLIPANSIWWMGQGISLEELGQTQQALDSYQQAISTGRLSSQLREFVLLRIINIKPQNSQTP